MYKPKNIRKDKDFIVTLDNILKKVSEYDIYARYIGKFKVGNIYNSPFRKDKNPSFGVFFSKRNNKLMFKDHGTGESGDVIKFVSLYTGLTNYNDILQRIVKDLSITTETPTLISVSHYHTNSDINIGVVRQEFTDIDIKYWNQYHISTDTLKLFKVNSIKYYLCNGIVKWQYKADNPMYSYKINEHFKIYRPFADKKVKWRNNLTEHDIQGFNQLPYKGDLLIITKSLKDVMCLYEMGINAISPSSESTFLTDEALEILKKRFKHILILYDRDIPGIKNARKISKRTGLKTFLVNKKWNAKDISDAIKLNGFNNIKNWLYEYLLLESR